MKKMLFYGLSIALVFTLLQSNIQAIDFAGHEDEYSQMCQDSANLSKQDIEVCSQYTDYLKNKNSYLSDDIAFAQQQLAMAVQNQALAAKQLALTQTQIESVQQELKVLNEQIKIINKRIVTKKELLRDRMYVLQTYMNGNELLHLLLSAGSLDDFITRVQCIDELTNYDQDLLIGLQKDLTEVEEKTQEATARYDDLFALQTQQTILMASINNEISGYQNDIDLKNQLIANYIQEIGYIDDSLTEAEQILLAEQEYQQQQPQQPEKPDSPQTPVTPEKPESPQTPVTPETPQQPPQQPEKPTPPAAPEPEPEPEYEGNWGIVNTAYSKLGCEYVYGGTGPNVFDCSGFAQWVYRQNGIYIPRTVTPQYYACEHVSTPKPGDLLFFNTYTFLGHVGIYVGNGMFIHAGTEATGVCLANMYSAYWQNCYQGAGRYY